MKKKLVDGEDLFIRGCKASKVFKSFCANNDLVYGRMFDEMFFYYVMDNQNVPKYIRDQAHARLKKNMADTFRESNFNLMSEVREMYFIKKGISELMVHGVGNETMKEFLTNACFVIENHHQVHRKDNIKKFWGFVKESQPHLKRFVQNGVKRLQEDADKSVENRFDSSLKDAKKQIQTVIKGRYGNYGKELI